jgi:hypothetical protein
LIVCCCRRAAAAPSRAFRLVQQAQADDHRHSAARCGRLPQRCELLEIRAARAEIAGRDGAVGRQLGCGQRPGIRLVGVVGDVPDRRTGHAGVGGRQRRNDLSALIVDDRVAALFERMAFRRAQAARHHGQGLEAGTEADGEAEHGNGQPGPPAMGDCLRRASGLVDVVVHLLSSRGLSDARPSTIDASGSGCRERTMRGRSRFRPEENLKKS